MSKVVNFVSQTICYLMYNCKTAANVVTRPHCRALHDMLMENNKDNIMMKITATKQNKFPDSNKGFQEVILEDDEMTEKVNHLEYLKMPCYKLK